MNNVQTIPDHPANNFVACTQTVSSGLGTLSLKADQAYFGSKCPNIVNANQSGSFTYNIPWEYVTANDLLNPHQFIVTSQVSEQDGSTLIFTTTKGNANSSHALSDPSTPCPGNAPCN